MAFKELPSNNRLLEQFDAETVSDFEAYNPNVKALAFKEYSDATILGGVQTSRGQQYTREDSVLEFAFEDPTSIYLDNDIVGEHSHEMNALVWGMGGEQEADMDDLEAFGFQLIGEKPPENWTQP